MAPPGSLPLLFLLTGLGLLRAAVAQTYAAGENCGNCQKPGDVCMGWDGTMDRRYDFDDHCPNGCTCGVETCEKGNSCHYGDHGRDVCVTSSGFPMPEMDSFLCPTGDICTCRPRCTGDNCRSPFSCVQAADSANTDPSSHVSVSAAEGCDTGLCSCQPTPCGDGHAACGGVDEVCVMPDGTRKSPDEPCVDCVCERAFCAQDSDCIGGAVCVAYETGGGFTRNDLTHCDQLGRCFCKQTCSSGMACGGIQACREFDGTELSPFESCAGPARSCFCSDPLSNDERCAGSFPYNNLKGEWKTTPPCAHGELCTCQVKPCNATDFQCPGAHSYSVCTTLDGRLAGYYREVGDRVYLKDESLGHDKPDAYRITATLVEQNEDTSWLTVTDNGTEITVWESSTKQMGGRCVSKCNWESECQDGSSCAYTQNTHDGKVAGAPAKSSEMCSDCTCHVSSCMSTADCALDEVCFEGPRKLNLTEWCQGFDCMCGPNFCHEDTDCLSGSICTDASGMPLGPGGMCDASSGTPCMCTEACTSGKGCQDVRSPEPMRCVSGDGSMLAGDDYCRDANGCLCVGIRCLTSGQCPTDTVCMWGEFDMDDMGAYGKMRNDNECPGDKTCYCKRDVCAYKDMAHKGCEYNLRCVPANPDGPFGQSQDAGACPPNGDCVCKPRCSQSRECGAFEECIYTPPPDKPEHSGKEPWAMIGRQYCPVDSEKGWCSCQAKSCNSTSECMLGGTCVDSFDQVCVAGSGAECTCKWLECEDDGACPGNFRCGHANPFSRSENHDPSKQPQMGWPLLPDGEQCQYWGNDEQTCMCYPSCSTTAECQARFSDNSLCIHRNGESLLPGDSCRDGECVCRDLPCAKSTGCLGGKFCTMVGTGRTLTNGEVCPEDHSDDSHIPKSLRNSCTCTSPELPCWEYNDCPDGFDSCVRRLDGKEEQKEPASDANGWQEQPDPECRATGCSCQKKDCDGNDGECTESSLGMYGYSCQDRAGDFVHWSTGLCSDDDCFCKPSQCQGPNDCEIFDTCLDSVFGLVVKEDGGCLSGKCTCVPDFDCYEPHECMMGFVCVDSNEHRVLSSGDSCHDGPCHCAATCSQDADDCGEGLDCLCAANGCFCTHPRCERQRFCKHGEGCYAMADHHWLGKDEDCNSRKCSCAPFQCGGYQCNSGDGSWCVHKSNAKTWEWSEDERKARCDDHNDCLCLRKCENHNDCTNSDYAAADSEARCWNLQENRTLYYGETCPDADSGQCVCKGSETFATTTTARVTTTQTMTTSAATSTTSTRANSIPNFMGPGTGRSGNGTCVAVPKALAEKYNARKCDDSP